MFRPIRLDAEPFRGVKLLGKHICFQSFDYITLRRTLAPIVKYDGPVHPIKTAEG